MGYIRGFDGIRAFAAMAVVITHAGVWCPWKRIEISPNAFIDLVNGWAGVQAFFVLSGFLITQFLIMEFRANKRIALKAFYIRRTFRIFPLYFLVVGLIALLHMYDTSIANINASALAYAFFYIYNFVPNADYSKILGHTWSLAVEEHFYLICPVIFIVLMRCKTLFTFALLSIFCLASWALLSYCADLEWAGLYKIHRWTFFAGSYIALGCLGAIAISDMPQVQSFLRKAPAWPLIPVCLSTAIFAGSWVEIGTILWGICFVYVIAWIYCNQQSKLVNFLEIRPLNYLGKVSYGRYMRQGFFLETGPGRVSGQIWPPSPLKGLLLLIIVVPFSYHFFETPVRRQAARFK